MFVLVKSISFPLGVWVGILNLIVPIPGLYFLLYLTYNKPKLIFFCCISGQNVSVMLKSVELLFGRWLVSFCHLA